MYSTQHNNLQTQALDPTLIEKIERAVKEAALRTTRWNGDSLLTIQLGPSKRQAQTFQELNQLLEDLNQLAKQYGFEVKSWRRWEKEHPTFFK